MIVGGTGTPTDRSQRPRRERPILRGLPRRWTGWVMPLQNRVDPWGNLIAVEARGAWLGNRGILHDANQTIVAPWRHQSWIVCQLEFKGRKRKVFTPNNYSELFFLDEATAFSAGHRPCAECRRDRFLEFKNAWMLANLGAPQPSLPIAWIDKRLHSERAARGGRKVTYTAKFRELPFGAFIEREGRACLYWRGELKPWSPAGYLEALVLPQPREIVRVLTPKSLVRMFAGGFTPEVHPSATD